MGTPPTATPLVVAVRTTIHWLDVVQKWQVKISRWLEDGGGNKLEQTFETFATLAQALQFLLQFWGAGPGTGDPAYKVGHRMGDMAVLVPLVEGPTYPTESIPLLPIWEEPE